MILNHPEQNLILNAYKQGYEQLSDILNKITIGVIVVNREGRVCCSNAVADALFCPNGKDLKGTLFGMPLTNGDSYDIDIIRPVLGIGIAEIRTDATTWNGEEATLLMIQDVTAQRSMYGQIRKLSQAVEQSMGSIVITDTEGNIEYVNPKFTQITGYTREEAVGQNPRILKSGTTPPEEYKRLWDTIAAGNEWQGEFCNKKKNGELFWELAQIAPMKNEAGVITNYLAVKEDITNMKRAQREQEELKEQLFHVQKLDSVGRLAGGIAHDFNNVLMAITGYASLIQMELQGDEPISGYVRKIIESSGKAANLTQSLLAFSRRQPVSLEPANLNKIIINMEHLFFRLLGETIECKIHLADKDLTIMADSAKIEQVVMNLVTNARDAMPQGGRLTVRTEMVEPDGVRVRELNLAHNGRYALLSVSDTGTGMDEATMKRIFEPFFTTKERGKGTGIGLATVYGTVKQHNGHIEVASIPNQGTTFDVYLPITDAVENGSVGNDAKAAVAARSPEAASTSSKTAKTLLVAEDEAAVRDSVVKILRHAGYRVISAGNGEDAVLKFREHAGDIDLLVFDVMMPGKNGKEAYNEIKKIKPAVKTIFMSGYSEDMATNREIQEEGLLFLQKPVIIPKLLEKIRDVLAQQGCGK